MTAPGRVRTVLGDIDPADLGRVDAHEHVFLRSSALPGSDFLDPERMTRELDLVKSSGIDTVVDLTTIGLGRQPSALADVARRSGVRIVAATGYHRDAHYRSDHWVSSADRTTLVDAMISDIADGMDDRDWEGPGRAPTIVRAGIIKIGASYHHLSAAEKLRLEAAAEAALTTGVSIAAHCEVGTASDDLLDDLLAAGVPSDRVMLAHMDRNPDPELHREILGRGARLVYDTVGRVKYRPESQLIDLIVTMVDAGYGDGIMLGTDVGRRESLTTYGGGPGMNVLGRTFVPRLTREIGEHAANAILVDTPARFLTLEEGVS
jgi:predicted metal-dependent phosphotriesterase family hydrolase